MEHCVKWCSQPKTQHTKVGQLVETRSQCYQSHKNWYPPANDRSNELWGLWGGWFCAINEINVPISQLISTANLQEERIIPKDIRTRHCNKSEVLATQNLNPDSECFPSAVLSYQNGAFWSCQNSYDSLTLRCLGFDPRMCIWLRNAEEIRFTRKLEYVGKWDHNTCQQTHASAFYGSTWYLYII